MNDKNIIKVLLIIIILCIILPIFLFLIKIFYKHFVNEKNLPERYGKGSWVVITGASRGQGKLLAEEFAMRHFNLILIGSSRTYKSANEIKRKYPDCKIKIIERDFSESLNNDEWWTEIEKIFNGSYDISILVNNVGKRTASNPSHSQSDEKIKESLITGTYPQAKLTKLALQYMTKREQLKPQYKSAIIFNTAQCIHPTFGLASNITGEISIPYLAVYEATNAFGFYHANSIISEYKVSNPNIDMLNIMPGAVLTENTQYLINTPFAIDAKFFAKNIIRLLGNWHGSTCAYWGHDISSLLIGLAPWKKEEMLRKVGLTLAENLKE